VCHKNFIDQKQSPYLSTPSGAYLGGGFKAPTLFGKFFQFARGFKKKNPKTPLNFPFYIKIFQNPSLEKFLDTPQDTPLKIKGKIYSISVNKTQV